MKWPILRKMAHPNIWHSIPWPKSHFPFLLCNPLKWQNSQHVLQWSLTGTNRRRRNMHFSCFTVTSVTVASIGTHGNLVALTRWKCILHVRVHRQELSTHWRHVCCCRQLLLVTETLANAKIQSCYSDMNPNDMVICFHQMCWPPCSCFWLTALSLRLSFTEKKTALLLTLLKLVTRSNEIRFKIISQSTGGNTAKC